MEEQLALGVDIGGTKIAFALVDAEGQVHAEKRIPTEAEAGAQHLLSRLNTGIKHFIAEAGQAVLGVGIGLPGYVNAAQGIVREAVNLGWHEVALAQAVQSQVALPVYIQNDCNAAALGEVVFGAARDCRDAVYIAIGTGLGVGIIANGQIITGSSGAAGEIGHIALTANGRSCRCGLRGCPEAYVSGVGLLAGFAEHAPHFPQSPLAARADVTPHDVLLAARAGDPLAVAVLDEAFAQFTQVIVFCAGLLNPQLFILGGGLGLALAQDWLPRIQSHLIQHTLPIASQGVRFAAAQLKSPAIGAAALVWKAVETAHK